MHYLFAEDTQHLDAVESMYFCIALRVATFKTHLAPPRYATYIGNSDAVWRAGQLIHGAQWYDCCYADKMLNDIVRAILFSRNFARDHVMLIGRCFRRLCISWRTRNCPSIQVFLISNHSNFPPSSDMHSSNVVLLLVGSALLGFGHGCFLTPKICTHHHDVQRRPIARLRDMLDVIRICT